MIHLGDITQIKGTDVPIVDIVTGGSPCQDLSVAVAGKRAGLDGERSGLFMEQIRIIKEMREYDRANRGSDVNIRLLRPRFMVWENVPGAFSSNNGEDFRIVLEETAKVAEGDACIPRFEERWPQSGCIMGNGWTIAWRVHDAQFWGVPQRRRRISLVADFGGKSAPKILFERKGLSRTNEADEEGGHNYRRNRDDSCETNREQIMIELGSTKHTVVRNGISLTLKARMGTGGNNVNAVIQNDNIRQFTPKEVERLQGFPDGWTDIGDWIDSKGKAHKGGSDSPRYKALGNSIALPFWQWMAYRMINVLKEDGVENPTMASLFDGIGGFPLVYQRAGCEPIWASEIEEFPIAVTKLRFPEEKIDD